MMQTKSNKSKDLPLIGKVTGKLKVHFRKANNAYKKGNLQQAYNEVTNMQRIDADDANANHLLAILLMHQQPPNIILQYLNKAQTKAPNDLVVRETYVEFLVVQKQFSEAIKQQQYIISNNENNISAWEKLVELAKKADDPVSLLEASSKLIELGHKNVYINEIKYALSRTATNEYKSHIEKALVHVFSQPDIDYQPFMAHAASLIVSKYKDNQLSEDVLGKLNHDTLLNLFLISGINVQLDFELWISKVRKKILLKGSSKSDFELPLAIIQALAIQGYYSGYIIQPDEEENAILEQLELKLSKSDNCNVLFLISMYRQPEMIEVEKVKLLFNASCIPVFRKTLYDNQLVELKLKKKINKENPISNKTSLNVREMYEESPYPQWNSLECSRSSPAEIANKLNLHSQHLYQNANIELLIAGCGTGIQSINAAFKYWQTKVKAIDISATSLAYAMRKTEEYQLDNISYELMDILSLVNCDKQYLMVESIGVLHHMADPESAFSIVRQKLKPGGLLRIGLYSKLARADINLVREKIKQQGIKPTLDGIRRFRKNNLIGPKSPFITVEGVFRVSDLGYSAGCRDLFFHVQEQQMTIPWIKMMLKRHDLSFKGFMFHGGNEHIQKQFHRRFNGEKDYLNLDLWHEYEKENPDTFINMYTFYSQCNKQVPKTES